MLGPFRASSPSSVGLLWCAPSCYAAPSSLTFPCPPRAPGRQEDALAHVQDAQDAPAPPPQGSRRRHLCRAGLGRADPLACAPVSSSLPAARPADLRRRTRPPHPSSRPRRKCRQRTSTRPSRARTSATARACTSRRISPRSRRAPTRRASEHAGEARDGGEGGGCTTRQCTPLCNDSQCHPPRRRQAPATSDRSENDNLHLALSQAVHYGLAPEQLEEVDPRLWQVDKRPLLAVEVRHVDDEVRQVRQVQSV